MLKTTEKRVTRVLTGAVDVIIGFGVHDNIVRIEEEMKGGRGLFDIIDEDEEEKGGKHRTLWDTSNNGLPHRTNATSNDAKGSLMKEGADPAPHTTSDAKLGAQLEQNTIVPCTIKGFGEVDEGTMKGAQLPTSDTLVSGLVSSIFER